MTIGTISLTSDAMHHAVHRGPSGKAHEGNERPPKVGHFTSSASTAVRPNPPGPLPTKHLKCYYRMTCLGKVGAFPCENCFGEFANQNTRMSFHLSPLVVVDDPSVIQDGLEHTR